MRLGRLPEKMKIGLATLAALIAWFFLLDFSKAPPLPQLEPSWMAAITFGAAEKLQFGRDIIYTYGPLGHLAFSTYSERLFTAQLVAEICLKGVYIALICLVSLRMRPLARAFFLTAAFAIAIISYQTLYVFSIAGLGWILIKPSRWNDLLLIPAVLFAAVAALIKLTFLWFALLVLVCGAVVCVMERRMVRALLAVTLFIGAFCSAWLLAGQEWGVLPAFLRTAREIMSGYSKTMSLPCPEPILTAGLRVGVLLSAQLGFLLSRNARQFSAWAITLLFSGALFLAWKLGFSRADAHTLEFFYFASLLALALPAFFERNFDRVAAIANWVLVLLILAFSAGGIFSQAGSLGRTLTSILRSRSELNLRTLLHPSSAEEGWRASDQQYAKELALPRIRETVGRSRVDVFGYEQAIALVNGLNYTPSPSVQSYCDYTPFLAELNAAFYRSERAPDYVIFKLQPIDNRLAALNYAEVLVRLRQNYEPLFVENGYLLLKRHKTSPRPLAAELVAQQNGKSEIGEVVSVPPGATWCELHLKETVLGKILAFLYHLPEIQIEITAADGTKTPRRFLPTLGSSGFLVNPFLKSEADFVLWAAGQQEPASTTQTITVVPGTLISLFYRPEFTYRLSQIPITTSPTPSAMALLRDLRGYTDIFSIPAALVNSPLPLQRFTVESRPFLLVHPIGEVRFDIPTGATAATGLFAFHPQAYLAGTTKGVEFQVQYVPSGSPDMAVTLFRRTLAPLTQAADRGIQQFRVELPPGEKAQLVLRTEPGPEGNLDWDWAGWSKIEFEGKP